VAVTGGSDTPNIDAPLGLGGSISGTVTDESTGEPLPGIGARALGPGPPWYFWPGFTRTDASGAYSQRGLRPGNYVVQFQDSSHTYVGEYYDNRWHSSTADPVTVSAGLDTPGINGALIENVPGLLKIGTLFPFTGSLADFGPELMRGAELAAKHLNQGGGVLGLPVVLLPEDDATSPTFGVDRAQSLIADWGVPAIVGAAASVVTIAVAEQVTIPNGVLLMSPASTSLAITNLADDDLVFRTVSSDTLQGAVLAQVAWDQGYRTACTMYLDNAYGQGISSSFTQAFEALGGTVQVQVPHGDQSSYLTELTECTSGNPDVLVALSYPEHGVVYLQEALDNEIIDQFVFSDGLKYQSMFDSLGPANFEGMYGTAPRATFTAEFSSAYEAEYGEPPPLPYIAETYDAVVSIALAAAAAGSTDSAAIRDALRGVVCPPGPSIGAGATEVDSGLQLAGAGEHLDYEGGTGSLEFTEYGDGARGTVEVWKIQGGLIVTDGEEPVTAPTDADGDGFAVCVEDYLGTDPLDACPDSPTDDAWPLDIDMNGDLSVTGDVINYIGRIGATPGSPNWWGRLDFDTDSLLSVTGDVFLYIHRIGEKCT
jgi:ABC-type branched-subunit amino acid transport system substrate-binding protein